MSSRNSQKCRGEIRQSTKPTNPFGMRPRPRKGFGNRFSKSWIDSISSEFREKFNASIQQFLCPIVSHNGFSILETNKFPASPGDGASTHAGDGPRLRYGGDRGNKCECRCLQVLVEVLGSWRTPSRIPYLCERGR